MKSLTFLLLLFILLVLCLDSCKEEEGSAETLLLTSKTWGMPLILPWPANVGMWTSTSCGEYHHFLENGLHTWKDECTGHILEGTWSCAIAGKEILINYQSALTAQDKLT